MKLSSLPFFYALIIVLAVIARLLPHQPNVAPIGALALFVGATNLLGNSKRSKMLGYSVPFAALFVSDWLIGFYSWQVMAAVYLGFGITMVIGTLVKRSSALTSIVLGALASSVIFFLLTNAAVWAFTPMYSQTVHGLIDSYVAALPFFRNSLFGDLAYCGAFFGAYELAIRSGVISQGQKTLTSDYSS